MRLVPSKQYDESVTNTPAGNISLYFCLINEIETWVFKWIFCEELPKRLLCWKLLNVWFISFLFVNLKSSMPAHYKYFPFSFLVLSCGSDHLQSTCCYGLYTPLLFSLQYVNLCLYFLRFVSMLAVVNNINSAKIKNLEQTRERVFTSSRGNRQTRQNTSTYLRPLSTYSAATNASSDKTRKISHSEMYKAN